MDTAKLILLAPFVFVVTGCAHDSYSVIPGSAGSTARLNSDLRECKLAVIDAYFAAKNAHDAPITMGALQGAAAGGRSGAISGALDAAQTAPPMPDPAEMNPNIERCMRDKGYIGTSEN